MYIIKGVSINMFTFTKRNVYFYTFIISIAIYILITTGYGYIKENYTEFAMDKTNNAGEVNIEIVELVQKDDEDETIDISQYGWTIEIPRINLIAPISEGTSGEVISKTVGHFEHTSIFEGNVGLASHNRGSMASYFERIKELEVGDLIIYKTEEGSKTYEVTFVEIILETDWSYLEQTEENRITLITCIENMPEYRRCVQGREIAYTQEIN